MSASTSPDCYASDDSFMQTLAYCMSKRCKDVSIPDLEAWWYANVAGRLAVQPPPKESYQQALAKVTEPPSEYAKSKNPLNKTSLVSDDDYISNFNAQQIFQEQEILYEKYG